MHQTKKGNQWYFGLKAHIALQIEGGSLDIVEFDECESRHIAGVYMPLSKALFSADVVYNHAHLYLQERHLESWLARLNERSEEHTSELQSLRHLVCRLLLE